MQWLIWLSLLCPLSWAEKELTQEEKDTAADKFLNGQVLFEEKEYDRAIKMWQEGYEITGKTGFLKNIAIAQEAKGDYKAAINTVFTLLEQADEDEQREFLRGWIQELKEKERKSQELAMENQEEQLAKQKAEQQALAEQKAKEEQLAKQEAEEQALAKQKAENERLAAAESVASQKSDNFSKAKPLYIAWGSTVALASGTGLLWASLDTDIPSGCAAYGEDANAWLCMETADTSAASIQQNIDGLNTRRTWSQVLTATSVVSTGVSIWLTSRYFTQKNFGQTPSTSTPVHLSVSPTGLTLKGEF